MPYNSNYGWHLWTHRRRFFAWHQWDASTDKIVALDQRFDQYLDRYQSVSSFVSFDKMIQGPEEHHINITLAMLPQSSLSPYHKASYFKLQWLDDPPMWAMLNAWESHWTPEMENSIVLTLELRGVQADSWYTAAERSFLNRAWVQTTRRAWGRWHGYTRPVRKRLACLAISLRSLNANARQLVTWQAWAYSQFQPYGSKFARSIGMKYYPNRDRYKRGV